MSFRAHPFLTVAIALGLAIGTAPTADSQTIRERIRERIEQRQAERQGAQAPGRQVSGARAVTIMQDGRQRTFYVYAPSTLASQPAVVLVFHGGGGNARRFLRSSNVPAAAEQGGFLAVFPDAGGQRWNDGRADTAGGADDVAFVRAIVDQLRQDYGADPNRIFATGISNGGIFTYKLACDASELVAGIAPVAANMPDALRADCAPRQGTPVMMFSGTDDPLMTFDGGPPRLQGLLERAGRSATEEMMSAPQTAQFWADTNGCRSASATDLPDARNDGTTVRQIDYSGCRGGNVILFQINGGGHAWPGDGTDSRLTGKSSEDINATATMVQFFRNFGL